MEGERPPHIVRVIQVNKKFEDFLAKKGTIEPMLKRVAKALEDQLDANILDISLYSEPRFSGYIQFSVGDDYFNLALARSMSAHSTHV